MLSIYLLLPDTRTSMPPRSSHSIWLGFTQSTPSGPKFTFYRTSKSTLAEDRDASWAGFLWGVRSLPAPSLFKRLKKGLLDLPTNPSPSRRSYMDAIAGLILGGWLQHHVSDAELRALVLRADDPFRSRFLWHLKDWSNAKDDGGPSAPARTQTLIQFFSSVWPRQLAAKSAEVSTRLCDLALSNEERFPVIQPVILPLVSRIRRRPSSSAGAEKVQRHYC